MTSSSSSAAGRPPGWKPSSCSSVRQFDGSSEAITTAAALPTLAAAGGTGTGAGAGAGAGGNDPPASSSRGRFSEPSCAHAGAAYAPPAGIASHAAELPASVDR